jgi:U1 small nuclear ribonucleoprotein C
VSLTHDSISVRRSHALGKNHITYVSDYYELAAKEEGLLPDNSIGGSRNSREAWKQLDQSSSLAKLNAGAPGLQPRNKLDPLQAVEPVRMAVPSNIPGLPQPPPQFYVSR